MFFPPYFQKHHDLVRRLNQSLGNQYYAVQKITKDTFCLVVATSASKNEERCNQNNQYDDNSSKD